MVNKVYFISAVGNDGITYFYHSDKCFRWNFCYINGTYFKTWERQSFAERAFNKMPMRNFKSISLMSCEVGKDVRTESVTIKTK